MAEGDLIRMGIGIDTLSLDHGPSKDFPTRQFTHFAPFSVRAAALQLRSRIHPQRPFGLYTRYERHVR